MTEYPTKLVIHRMATKSTKYAYNTDRPDITGNVQRSETLTAYDLLSSVSLLVTELLPVAVLTR